jgi:predicted lysophospholipase L1 biosynthesis ABC-type transport system permease subunit
MFKNLAFYLKHSLNDLTVNLRRTAFALLCIASGVAAVTALQIIGNSMNHTITVSGQEKTRADIKLRAPDSATAPPQDLVDAGLAANVLSKYETGFGYVEYGISPQGLEAIREWLDKNAPGELLDVTTEQQVIDPRKLQIKAISRGTQAYGPKLFLIDRTKYPLYGNVQTTAGLPLAQALTAPNEIAINHTLAAKLKLQPGDEVRLAGASGIFRVTAIVSDTAEAGADAQLLQLSGFIYLDQSGAAAFNRAPSTTVAYLKLRSPEQAQLLQGQLRAQFPYFGGTSIDENAGANAGSQRQIALIAQVMGFLSLLIGGIGIINTMNVIVRRRLLEVAVLKTIGLQGGQISALFIVEAVLMGLIGSVIGVALGYVLPLLLRNVASGVLEIDLKLRYLPTPALAGLAMGLVVTAVFGVLPTLSAARIRPISVLRPGEPVSARVGGLSTLLVMVGMIVALVLVAMPIFGNPLLALGAVAGGFVGAGVLAALLAVLLAVLVPLMARVVGVDLRIGLRSLLAARTRAITTMLALSIGALMLGLILLMVNTLVRSLQNSAADLLGGTAQLTLPSKVTLQEVEQALQRGDVPGYRSHFRTASYTVVLKRIETAEGTFTPDELRAKREQTLGVGALANLQNNFITLSSRQYAPHLVPGKMADGRALTAADKGQPLLQLPNTPVTIGAGFKPGDKLTFALGGPEGEEMTFTVAGIEPSGATGFGGGPIVPEDALPTWLKPLYYSVTTDVDEAELPALKARISRIPNANYLGATELNRDLVALVRQFMALPTVITVISLIVGAVVIANSVALSTMERKRDIGVMKAMGLQRERVLGMLLGESAVLGFIGGLVGVGLALIGILIMRSTGVFGTPEQLARLGNVVSYEMVAGLLALCVCVSVLAALLSAWGASGEKPLNVLRYE